MDTDNYRPIPVAVAKEIAELYAKDQVLIFGWDRRSGLMHTTTYGRTKQDKVEAAQGGDLVAGILTDMTRATVYEDFRRPKQPDARQESLFEGI